MKTAQFKFKIAILILVILLTSCSSTNNSTSYYLLNAGLKTDSTLLINKQINEQAESKKIILLELEKLPEYLSQRYLVMQLDEHRLHYAQFHLWAEPLFDGIQKALLKDLNTNNSQMIFIANTMQHDKSSHSKLHIQVEHFFANNQSSVSLSGKYWFDNKSTEGIQSYYFTKDLLQNGYPHSVEKMRNLLTLLSEEILNKNI